jgi:hypothetical protein
MRGEVKNPISKLKTWLWSTDMIITLLLLLWGGRTSDHYTVTVSDLLCVRNWFLIIPDSSTRVIWQLPAETSSSEVGKMFRAVFWVILPCKMIVDRRFRGAYCLHHQGWVKPPAQAYLVHLSFSGQLIPSRCFSRGPFKGSQPLPIYRSLSTTSTIRPLSLAGSQPIVSQHDWPPRQPTPI